MLNESNQTLDIDDFLDLFNQIDINKLSLSEKKEMIALIEIKLKRRAVNSFWAFCLYWDMNFYRARKSALRDMARTYQMLYDDDLDEAYMSIAPSSGKTYMMELFHAWIIGKDSEDSVMYCSYNDDKATDVSKAVKEMVADDRYLDIFGNKTAKRGFQQARMWKVEGAKKETYFVGSPRGQGTGYHARWICGDDLVKNIEDALNSDLLQKIWFWWLAVPQTRKEKVRGKKPKVIIIGTRWSDDDPIGMKIKTHKEITKKHIKMSDDLEILELRDGRTVGILKVKALRDDLSSYCDEIITADELLAAQRESDEMIFSAIFQQEPINARGRLFKLDDVNRFKMSDYMKDEHGNLVGDFVIGRVDLADKGKDKTASVIGIGVDDDVFITDIIYTDDELETYKPLLVSQINRQSQMDQYVVESNFEGRSTAAYLRRESNVKSKRKILDLPTTKNKEAKIMLKSGFIKTHFHFLDVGEYKPGSDYDRAMKDLFKYEKMKKKQVDDVPDVLASMVTDIEKFSRKAAKTVGIYMINK